MSRATFKRSVVRASSPFRESDYHELPRGVPRRRAIVQEPLLRHRYRHEGEELPRRHDHPRSLGTGLARHVYSPLSKIIKPRPRFVNHRSRRPAITARHLWFKTPKNAKSSASRATWQQPMPSIGPSVEAMRASSKSRPLHIGRRDSLDEAETLVGQGLLSVNQAAFETVHRGPGRIRSMPRGPVSQGFYVVSSSR